MLSRAAAAAARLDRKRSGGPELAQAVEGLLEAGRSGVNGLLRQSLGLEVKRAAGAAGRGPKDLPPAGTVPDNSFFWNPYGPNSPFVNRAKYLEQFERADDAIGACNIVTEEDIMDYVDSLCSEGALASFRGPSALLVPKALYANVVKVALRVLQTAVGSANGQTVLGRELHVLKRKSMRAPWRVSRAYQVDDEIVQKIVRRVMADHGARDSGMSNGVEQQVYHNVVTLIFRLMFDLVDSCQLRVLGHTVTVKVEADPFLAQAPGWDVSLDSGIFGRFDGECKRQFVSDFVDDLLQDESIKLAHLPDIAQKTLYMSTVLLLFELLETACNHLRLHVAGISLRPALDDVSKRRGSKS